MLLTETLRRNGGIRNDFRQKAEYRIEKTNKATGKEKEKPRLPLSVAFCFLPEEGKNGSLDVYNRQHGIPAHIES
jgi:hypothetical protein